MLDLSIYLSFMKQAVCICLCMGSEILFLELCACVFTFHTFLHDDKDQNLCNH